MRKFLRLKSAHDSLEKIFLWSISKKKTTPPPVKNKKGYIKAIDVSKLIDKYQETYANNFQQIQNYQEQLDIIKSSKTYKLWRKFNLLKKILNPFHG